MTEPVRTRVGFIGGGVMARVHLNGMLARDDTTIAAICEPSAQAYAAVAELFDQPARPAPPNEPDWRRFVGDATPIELDAVIIITPARLPLRPGDGLPRGRPRRPAREADGDDGRRGRRR